MDSFDKQFNFFKGLGLLAIIVNIGIVVFIGWIVIKVLQYFGII